MVFVVVWSLISAILAIIYVAVIIKKDWYYINRLSDERLKEEVKRRNGRS